MTSQNLLLAFVAYTTILVVCGQTNILQNAGFEDPLNSTTDWWCYGNCVTTLDSDAHSGSNSVKITSRNRQWKGPIQSLPADLPVGILYRVSAYAKLLPGGLGSDQEFFIVMRYTLQDGTHTYIKPIVVRKIQPANGWVILRADYTIEEFGQATTAIEMYVAGPDAGETFLVDSTSMIRLQLLNDPDFEASDWTVDWQCPGAQQCSLVSGGVTGNALLSTARTGKWQGPRQSVPSPSTLPGRAFYLSAFVKLESAASGVQGFTITFMHVLADGSRRYIKPAALSGVTAADGWVEISGEYIVADYGQQITDSQVYVEGPAAGVDFSTDSFTMTAVPLSIWFPRERRNF